MFYVHAIILTILCVAISLRFVSRNSAGGIVDKSIDKGINWFLSLLLFFEIILLYGLRHQQGDTWRYLARYREYPFDTFGNMLLGEGSEIGFRIISWAISVSGASDELYLIILALASFSVLALALKQYYHEKWVFLLVIYMLYPFSLAYYASGMRQGIALSISLLALVTFVQSDFKKIIPPLCFLLLAVLFHNSALIIIAVVLVLYFFNKTLRLFHYLCILATSIFMSMTSLNKIVLGILEPFFEADSRYQYYLDDEKNAMIIQSMNYQVGFRLDFTLFSVLPLFYILTVRNHLTNDEKNFVKVFILLNSIWQLLSFVHSNDRVAAISWFLLPILLLSPRMLAFNSGRVNFYYISSLGLVLSLFFGFTNIYFFG